MIRTRHPTGIFTHHSGTPNKDILDGIVQAMTHVKDPRNIRWWDYNRVGFPVIRGTFKIFMIEPVLVPFLFCGLKIKCFGDLHELRTFKVHKGSKKVRPCDRDVDGKSSKRF